MWLSNGYAVAFAQPSVGTARGDLDKALQRPKAAQRTASLKYAEVQRQIGIRQNAGLDRPTSRPRPASTAPSSRPPSPRFRRWRRRRRHCQVPASWPTRLTRRRRWAEPKRNMVAGIAFGLVFGLGSSSSSRPWIGRSGRPRRSARPRARTARTDPARPRKLRSKDEIAMMATGGGNHVEANRKLRVALDFAELQPKPRS